MRSAWLEINLDTLAQNLQTLRARAGNLPAVGVVKANAYGHGAVEIGKELLRLGAWGLAVATLEEARVLRRAGIVARILLLGSLHPRQAGDVLELDLIPSLSTVESAEALNALGKPVSVHLEFDTGMGRTGFSSAEAPAVRERLAGLENVLVQGIYSHFADAEEDTAWTLDQVGRFEYVQSVFGAGYFYHLANTAGTVHLPQMLQTRPQPQPHLSAIRPGIGLYGLIPGWGVQPIARVLVQPTLVKQLPAGSKIGYNGLYTTQADEWIATLPIGYADGMPRTVFNRATVRLEQESQVHNCLVVGRVSMDQITVRIPGPVGLGQVFEAASADFSPTGSLWGWAELVGSSSYEPAVRLAHRLPRVYVRGGQEVARCEP